MFSEDRMIKLGSMDVEKHPDGDVEITVPEYLSSEYLDVADQEKLVAFLQENIKQQKENNLMLLTSIADKLQ